MKTVTEIVSTVVMLAALLGMSLMFMAPPSMFSDVLFAAFAAGAVVGATGFCITALFE